MTEKPERVPIFTGKSQEMLLEYRFNTPDDKLLEMSILSSKQALAIAIMQTINDGRNFARDIAIYQLKLSNGDKTAEKPKMFWLSDRFTHYFLQAQRSTGDGRTLKDASDLSMASVEASIEPEEFTEPPIESA